MVNKLRTITAQLRSQESKDSKEGYWYKLDEQLVKVQQGVHEAQEHHKPEEAGPFPKVTIRDVLISLEEEDEVQSLVEVRKSSVQMSVKASFLNLFPSLTPCR